MQKKILLCTDFSKSSWNAIQYAVKLYEDQDCDFYILNTYAKDVYGLEGYTLLDPDEAFGKLSENHSKKELGHILTRLSEIHKNRNHRFHAISRSELFRDAVKNLVESLQLDLIVMGAKGLSTEGEGKYGKNTLRVVEHIRSCPVLVVPRNAAFDRPEEIVLATNFTTDFNEPEIKYLVEIAKINNAHIQVLSLADGSNMTSQQKQNKMLLRKHLKGTDHKFNVVHNVKMSAALSAFVEIKQSNMISYLDKKPSLWETLGLVKPSFGKLGFFKDVPVLALHG